MGIAAVVVAPGSHLGLSLSSDTYFCVLTRHPDLRSCASSTYCEHPAASTGFQVLRAEVRVMPLGPEARAVLAALPREGGNPWGIRGWLPGSDGNWKTIVR